jgi:hypothetical protein
MTEWNEVIALVHQQAEDEGLWFLSATASEAYLQQELRRLHAAVEGLLEDRRHIIQFEADDWIIAHPLAERLEGSLLDCHLRWDQGDPELRGRYWLNDDGTVGERVP